MVGDGMNDLPAQSTADLSVIVCGGSESSGLGAGLGFSAPSDLTLLPRADLDGLYEATRIARKVMRQARMNLGWALAYNVVALLAATGCLDWTGIRLDVSMTGMMMAMSSVCVLLLSQLVHY
jgi:cation transport ATPase